MPSSRVALELAQPMMVVGDESAMSRGSVSYHQHKADLGWNHRMRFSDFLEELLAHDTDSTVL